jgi:chorismate mutase
MEYQDILKEKRIEIDRLDDQITALLMARAAIIGQVAEIKKAHDIPVVLPDRVKDVVLRNRETALKVEPENEAIANYIEAVFSDIVRHSCDLEGDLMQKDASKDG